MWQLWVSAVLGIVLAVLPFTGLEGNAFLWTLVAGGTAITFLSLWSVWEATIERENGRMIPAHW